MENKITQEELILYLEEIVELAKKLHSVSNNILYSERKELEEINEEIKILREKIKNSKRVADLTC